MFGSVAPGSQANVTQYHNESDLVTNMHFDLSVICGAFSWSLGSTGTGTSTTNFSIDDIWSSQINLYAGGRTYKCIRIGSGTTPSLYPYDIFIGFGEPSLTHIAFILGQYNGGAANYIRSDEEFSINEMYSKTSIHFSLSGVGGSIDTRLYAVYGGVASLVGVGQTALIPSDDITSEFQKNFKYRFMVSRSYIKSHVAVSTRTSATDKGYGQVEGEDYYYDTPNDTQEWLPVRKESWFDGFSVWVGDCIVEQNYWNYYRGDTYVSDFYLFTDAVRAVIKKIDPSIEFEENDSHFLFDNPNPLPSSAKPQGPLYISQKSNVLNLGYDYPAWQAPIKWSQIETFLKNALGCYWDLYEDSNGVTHLRIEHQFFYDNGGTYNPQGNPSATIDLLHNRFDVATRQPQAFHTNRWKWDTDGNGLYSSACRYEYGWMDTQSAIFDGETIEVPEEYRLFTDDKTEERKVDWFSSDIDFLTAVQAECSSDGFVVVMESYTNPGWIVSGHENYSGQNYQMSFEYLQPLYLVYGIYAEKVKIGDNGTAYDTGSHARMRTSEVSFNLLEGEWVEPSDILVTEAGNGVIDTLTYDMSSEKWTATVRYNNE